MTGNKADVEAALDSLRGNRKATFHLRRFLGLETRYDEINGHIFDPDPDEDEPMDEWCQASGCEMSTREFAEDHDCPTPLEAYDMKMNNDGF
jgi:hypothetical protein